MVRVYRIIFFIFVNIFFIGCSSTSLSIQDEILLQYNQGIEFYNNKRYSKAKDFFEYVISHSTGSRIALEAEFYLAEALYNLKEYQEALYNYDSYARSSQDLQLIELSRFRLCQCAYELTNSYDKDQTTTFDALEKMEIFLEDYFDSDYYEQVIELKVKARYKLAKKEYESAKLYMKLGEYKSALIYLHNVLENYADTDIADDIRLTVIFAYILNENHDLAKDFYNIEIDNFNDLEKRDEAITLINSTDKGIKITEYFRLFK